MDLKDVFYIFLIFLFILLISTIFYSLTTQITKSIKNKKIEIEKVTFFSVFSILELLTLELIQENSNMFLQSMFVTFAFLFFLNYFLGKLKHYKLFIMLFFVIFYIYGIIQRFVVCFKGIPFGLNDILAIETAVKVSSKYEIKLTNNMILSAIFMLILLGLLFRIPLKNVSKNKSRFIFIQFIGYIIFILIMTFNTNVLDFWFNVNYWNPPLALKENGSLGHLYVDFVNAQFKYPDDYDEENIKKIVETTEVENYEEKINAVNIICILEESLYDLNIIDDLDLNQDNLSYYHSLEKNTIKGNVIVSSLGGGTANSEWEFLTNGNMLFMPKGTYPFARYIRNENVSLASVLKDLNFRTISFHPFSGLTWNRPNVYSYLGFDEYYAVENLPELKSNPNNLIRGYVSDEANMQQIIDFYENKKAGENLFIYNVTIQNHAGYEEDFGLNDIFSNKYESQTLSTYLTLINETDKSIKKLIEYFEKVEEPTLICIFGDHYPGTFDNNDKVDKALRGPDYLSGDEKLLRYTTPFLIHTNYDIEETDYYDGISLSYLSTLVMDYANLPKSKEQTFVQSFIDKYPIINEWGYKLNGEWFNRTSLPEDLKLWRDLTYYNLNYEKH